MVWLLTFHCYGTGFHFPPALEEYERNAMKEAPFHLGPPQRKLTADAVQQVCQDHRWKLFASHVRETHVHVVVECGDTYPAEVTIAFKRRSSQLMNAAGLDHGRTKRWARNGCYVRVKELTRAVDYVVRRQGRPMVVFVGSLD